MTSDKEILLDNDEVARTLARMAHEALEKTGKADDMVLIGIRSRGIHLARRLARKIEEFARSTPPVGVLDVTPYRDDRHAGQDPLPGTPGEILVPVENRTVVLVDDVIYRGRTVRAALEAIEKLGQPKRVLLAVLIDRGARELPIRADIVGKNVQAHDSMRVNVQLEESDGVDRVRLIPWETGGAH